MYFLLISLCNLWISSGCLSLKQKPILHAHSPIQNTLADTSLVELKSLDPTLLIDMRYATSNNFTGKILYPCAKAYLRKPAALALISAHQKFKNKGFRIKIFDAYRPLSVQWKLWNMYKDPNYVADPRKGSMHNRAVAIDLTLVDKNGKELDMGTDFDYFGERAHPDYQDLPRQVRANRYLLKSVLKEFGFLGIRTEWWHFSYQKQPFNLLNSPFQCK